MTDPATIAPHNVDWLHNVRGQSALLLRPRTTHEVSRILTHCNNRRYFTIYTLSKCCCDVHLLCVTLSDLLKVYAYYLYRLAVVPQGGNTGLVGE